MTSVAAFLPSYSSIFNLFFADSVTAAASASTPAAAPVTAPAAPPAAASTVAGSCLD